MPFGRKSPKSQNTMRSRRQRIVNHDTTLLASTTPNRLPKPKQFKFLFRFFSKKETGLFSAGVALIVIGVVIWGYTFVKNHRVIEPEVGGDYSEVIVGSPRLINPLYSSANEVDHDLTRLLFSGLMRYDASGTLVPDLVESLDVNDDGTTYTATLAENLSWHDGTPLTALDVVFTIERIQDPAVASPLRLSFQGVIVEQIDDRRIAFTLENAFAAFPHALTVGLIPQHVWATTRPSGMKLADANIRPIGNGPYKFVELAKNRGGIIVDYTIERNTAFHRGAPFVESMKLSFAPDVLSAVDMYTSKRVDAIHFVPRNNREEFTKRDTTIHQATLPQYTALFFNEKRNEALETTKVRQALAHAIDRQQMIDRLFGDSAVAIQSVLIPGMPGADHAPDVTVYPFSLTSSTALLDDAGWDSITRDEFIVLRTESLADEWEAQETPAQEEATDDTAESAEEAVLTDEEIAEREAAEAAAKEEIIKRRKELETLAREQITTEIPPSQEQFRKKGDDVLTVTITTADSKETKAAAEHIQSLWQAIGVHVIIQEIDPQLMQSQILKNRNYEIVLFGEVLGADYDLYPFWHSSQVEDPGLNLSLYINRSADDLLDKIRTLTDHEERVEEFQNVADKIQDDLPAIFLYSPKYLYAQRKKIQGFSGKQFFSPADRFNTVEKWFIETKGSWK